MQRIVIINGHPDDISILRAFYAALFTECDIQFISKSSRESDREPAIHPTEKEGITTREI